MNIYRLVIICFLSINLCFVSAQTQASQNDEYFYGKTPQLTPEMVQRQTSRARMVGLTGFFWGDILGVKPGMTILDLGAGTGQNAFIFAETLNGTGKVFATDINIDAIHHMSKQAKKRNLVNLYPVLVKSEGLDEFYTKNKFDLIFVAHAYYYLRDRVDYFRKLKDSLAENGRLVILDTKDFQKFSSDDVSDFDGLIKQLSGEKTNSPFYVPLQESTKKLLRQPLKGNVLEVLKKTVVADLNAMVEDTGFISAFLEKDGFTLKKEVTLTPQEQDFVYSKIRKLKIENKVLNDKGALDENNKNVTNEHYFSLKMINTVLVVQKFRQYLYGGEPPPYMPNGFGNWEKDCVRELPLAGYRLDQKYDFMPFHIVFSFTPIRHQNL